MLMCCKWWASIKADGKVPSFCRYLLIKVLHKLNISFDDDTGGKVKESPPEFLQFSQRTGRMSEPTLPSTELLTWTLKTVEPANRFNFCLTICVSSFVCLQAQGRRPLSGCWLEDSNLTEEVSLTHKHKHVGLFKRRTVQHVLTKTHTHWPVSLSLSLSGEVPILNVSYKPQTISPKFKVWWVTFYIISSFFSVWNNKWSLIYYQLYLRILLQF